jgi:hypothetical protein
MLCSEYFTALQLVYADAREENARATYETACEVYRMPRLDAVCSGTDRHLALVRWIAAHERLFARYHHMRNAKRWARRRKLLEMKGAIDFELMLLG